MRFFGRRFIYVGGVLVSTFILNIMPLDGMVNIETVEATSYSENRNTWMKMNNEWYYMNDNGATTTDWNKVGNHWYYMNTSGAMQTGWNKVGNHWYYMNASGAMQTGWNKVGNHWYYMNASGAMQTGWNKVGNHWYYMYTSGAMNNRVGWNKIGGNWYYQLPSGAMDTGWCKVGSKWYYLKSNAVMQTGWLKLGDAWYYLNTSGAMQTGWQNISGTSYYFNASGRMQSQTDSTSFNLAAVQREFHHLVNQERVANGRKKLAYINELDDAAGLRAYEVREIGGLFSHTRPNGTSFRSVHNMLNGFNSGENVLRFSKYNRTPSNQRIAERMFNQWKNSPGHYANMLSNDYTHHSLGVYLEEVTPFTNYNGVQLLYIAR